MASSDDWLVVRVDDGVGRITLNQPAKRNAVSYDMWVGIAEAMEGSACAFTVDRLNGASGDTPFAEVRSISNTTGNRGRQRRELTQALERLSSFLPCL